MLNKINLENFINQQEEVTSFQKTLLLINDKKIESSNLNNALLFSSETGCFESVKLLLNDDRVNPSHERNYALLLSSQNGHFNIVELLLNNEHVYASSSDCFTSLSWAAANGHLNVVKLLLKKSKINPTKYNNKIILNILKNSQCEMIKLLWNDERIKTSLMEDNVVAYNKLVKIDTQNKLRSF
jgi:ankyrin repeat protein